MRQIIFDLDDTLYSNKNIQSKRERVILKFVSEMKDKYLELKKIHGTIGSLKILGIEREEFFRLMNQVKIELPRDIKLIELLKIIKKDFKIVILSNNSEHCVKETINKLGISEFVDKFYSGEDFTESKPCEDCFFMVKSKDVCVGNNFEKDLAYPLKKGAITVMVGKSEKAHFNIKNIYELEKCIKDLKNEDVRRLK